MAQRLTLHERAQLTSRYEVGQSVVQLQIWCRSVDIPRTTVDPKTITNCHSKFKNAGAVADTGIGNGRPADLALLSIIGFMIIIDRHVRADTIGEVVFIHMAIPGYMVIMAALLITFVANERALLQELLFLVVGGILNIAAGAVILADYADDNKHSGGYNLFLGLVGLINGIVMIIDAILLVVNHRREIL